MISKYKSCFLLFLIRLKIFVNYKLKTNQNLLAFSLNLNLARSIIEGGKSTLKRSVS